MFDQAEKISEKMRSDDRILVLKVIDGSKPLSSTGFVDSRLFIGENKLHAVMDPNTCLWSFKYEKGITPYALKSNYTSFQKLYRYASEYFNKRNVEITEVVDNFKVE